jgi:hypothetical protein
VPLPRVVLFNLEQAARESLEAEIESMRRQNEDLRKRLAFNSDTSSGSKENALFPLTIKIDANKPAPNQELTRSIDDSADVYLGKQRQGSDKYE